jgi:Spy/CpxP family protein refolding chaperone
MNFLTKNRTVFGVLLFLIVLNIAVLASFYIFTYKANKKPETSEKCNPVSCQKQGITEELDLTDEQSQKVTQINDAYRLEAEPIAMAIRNKRDALLTLLENSGHDSLKLAAILDTISLMQRQIQLKNIDQYLELKKICEPEQALKLSALYRSLYGCPVKEKGPQRHQHRHGQGRNGQTR